MRSANTVSMVAMGDTGLTIGWSVTVTVTVISQHRD